MSIHLLFILLLSSADCNISSTSLGAPFSFMSGLRLMLCLHLLQQLLLMSSVRYKHLTSALRGVLLINKGPHLDHDCKLLPACCPMSALIAQTFPLMVPHIPAPNIMMLYVVVQLPVQLTVAPLL